MKSEAMGDVPWSLETSWVVGWGSLDNCVTVESSDHPIDDSDAEVLPRKFPLVLHPSAPQTGPCEIKVTFEQMYDVGQIYVRSTARAFEVYYTKSGDGSNEYLCTVRCGIAERDEEVLTAPCVSYAGEEVGDGKVTEETVADKDTGHSEDAWVNVKAPEVLRNIFLDKMNTSGMDHPQDLYEATAQISDSDPCSSLTIRLLSLQDRSQVYVDEVYVYVTPLGSCPENNMHLTGSSAQSSLMSMYLPAILQLSRSGVSQIQDTSASCRILENNQMESGSRIIQEKADEQFVRLDKQENGKVDPAELQKPTVANNCDERMSNNDTPGLPLEQTLQQLIGRFDRVEDICLRLEGKLMNHVEHVEARLQHIENKLEDLSKISQHSDLPNGTRIVVPNFLISDCNSSSFRSEQIDRQFNNASEVEKENCLYDSVPTSSCDTDLNPSVVDTAPEFSCDAGEEDQNYVNPVKISSISKSNKIISVDDALAAALDGFLSGSRSQPSSQNQAESSLCDEEDKENQIDDHIKFSKVPDQQLPTAQTAPFHVVVKALDFSESSGADETCYQRENLSDIDSCEEDMDQENFDLVIPHRKVNCSLTSTTLHEEQLVVSNSMCSTSLNLNFTCLDDGSPGRRSDVNARNECVKNSDPCDLLEVASCQSSDLAEDSEKIEVLKVQEKNFSESIISSNQNHGSGGVLRDASEHEADVLHHILQEYVNTEEFCNIGSPKLCELSQTSSLDFDFPILEVKFTSDINTLSSSCVEDLLCGLADSDYNIPCINDHGGLLGYNEQANTWIRNEDEHKDLLPIKDFLVDLEVSTKGMPSNVKSISDEQCSPTSLQLDLSLVSYNIM